MMLEGLQNGPILCDAPSPAIVTVAMTNKILTALLPAMQLQQKWNFFNPSLPFILKCIHSTYVQLFNRFYK